MNDYELELREELRDEVIGLDNGTKKKKKAPAKHITLKAVEYLKEIIARYKDILDSKYVDALNKVAKTLEGTLYLQCVNADKEKAVLRGYGLQMKAFAAKDVDEQEIALAKAKERIAQMEALMKAKKKK